MDPLRSMALKQDAESEKLSNPSRGCGHLKPGKAYIIGGGFSEGGVLPSWVALDPPLPFREIGTEGQFTRGFQKIDGLTMQLALEETTEFIPHYPGDTLGKWESIEDLIEHSVRHDTAVENHVKADVYTDTGDVPEKEADRHIDRIRLRGVEGGEHWGNIPITEQTDLLMRCGESYYPEPADYAQETINHGLSKAIPVTPTRDPPDVVPGITRCWIMHPAASEGFGGGIIGFAYLSEVAFTEPEEGGLPDYIDSLEQDGQLTVRGIEEPEPPEDVEKKGATALDDFDGDEDDDGGEDG